MNELPANGRELSLRERAELALRLAGLDVIAEHKRSGQPLVIWRDGKVLHVTAEEIEGELAKAATSSDGSNVTAATIPSRSVTES